LGHLAIIRPRFGQLAQLVEQRIENPRVRGSIPRLATSNAKAPTGFRRSGPYPLCLQRVFSIDGNLCGRQYLQQTVRCCAGMFQFSPTADGEERRVFSNHNNAS
jgi:hypothetical protein